MSYDAFLAEIRAEFPKFRIVPKATDALSRAIDVAVRVLSFGQQREYMTSYHTVLGQTLYVPTAWARMSDLDRVILLRHERVHLRQSRRFGALGMAFLYAVPFLPMGLAYGRARIEWEAYTETIRATAELRGPEAARSPRLREHVVSQFSSPAYLWMWPFRRSVERWYDEALSMILQGVG